MHLTDHKETDELACPGSESIVIRLSDPCSKGIQLQVRRTNGAGQVGDSAVEGIGLKAVQQTMFSWGTETCCMRDGDAGQFSCTLSASRRAALK